MFVLLFLLWVALNGKFTTEIVLFGIFISGFVYWFMCKCLDYSPKSDLKLLKNGFNIIKYIFILFVEITKSSYAVYKFIYAKEIDIQPQIAFYKIPLKNEFLKTILANSITLTPGTITLDVEDDVFCIHALDYTLLEDFEDSIFIKLLKEMEDN